MKHGNTFVEKMDEMGKTYQERKDAKRLYALIADGELVGIWGNLKKLCEEMKAKDPAFLTYSSLSKKKADENPIKFETAAGVKYDIYIEPIK